MLCDRRLRLLGSCAALVFSVSATAQEVVEKTPKSPSDVIIVTGQRDRPSNAATESLLGRTDVPLLDTPLVMQRLSATDLQAMAATDLYRAVRNISAVTRRPSYFGQNTATFTVRGFELDVYTHYLKDGFRYLAEGNQLMSNVDSVEVLKGAAAILYGRSKPGGVVNIVSKRPTRKASYELTASYGRFDSKQVDIGISGPLNKAGTWLYRVDLAGQDSGSFRDTVWNKTQMVAPQIMWSPNGETQMRLRIDWTRDSRRPDYGVPVFGNTPAHVPITRYYGEDFDYQRSTTLNALLSFETQLSQSWQLRAAYGHYRTRYSANTEQFYNDYVEGDMLYRSYARYPRLHSFDNGQIEAAGNFTLGNIEHHVLIGAEAEYRSEKSQPYLTYGEVSIGMPIFDPQYIHNYEELLRRVKPYPENMDFDILWGNVYVQDQIDLGDKWHALLGLRYMPGSFTPRAGILYNITSELSLFTSFARLAEPNYGSCSEGSCPDYPDEKSMQAEIGVKYAPIDGSFNASMALFDMRKKNVLVLDAFRDGDDVFEHRHQSRGVEMDISGDVGAGVRVVASYAYVDARAQVKADSPYYALANAARHSGSLWLSRDIILSAEDKLNFGTGLEARSRRWINTKEGMYMPGYVTADIAASWQHKQWNVALLGSNILNRTYYESTAGTSGAAVYPGRPRYWQIRVGLKY